MSEDNKTTQLLPRMSSNVANALLYRNNNNHSIFINPDEFNSISLIYNQNKRSSKSLDSICSYTLNNNLIKAISLSKWDHVVGPETKYIWTENTNVSELFKAINYNTNHTISILSSRNLTLSSSTSLLILPDFHLTSLSYQQEFNRTPFSISIIININHTDLLQQKFQVINTLLETLFQDLAPFFIKIEQQEHKAIITKCIQDFCTSFTGLFEIRNINNNSECISDTVLRHSRLSQIITSHLQTYSKTVIIGTTTSAVNIFIKFLSLFLDNEQVLNSSLVVDSNKMHTKFINGLYLQGVLSNAFGYRELSSIEMILNKYPVTVVDLTEESGVRQSLVYHDFYFDSKPTRSLYPVLISSSLVEKLIEELKLIPSQLWYSHIKLFNNKIKYLAQLLINLINKSTSKSCGDIIQEYLSNFNLTRSDFIIILAKAEKLKEGITKQFNFLKSF